MAQSRRSSALAVRTLQGWIALSALGAALSLGGMAGAYGSNRNVAIAWVMAGWSLHTLRLAYVWWVPNTPERLWTLTTFALLWAAVLAALTPQGGWLLLAVLTPYVWRATQRYGRAVGFRVCVAAWLAVGVGVLSAGSPVGWVNAAALTGGSALMLMVWGYAAHAYAMQSERNQLRHTVSRQRVNARTQRFLDPDTGLSNRRGVSHELSKLQARRARHNMPYAALLVRVGDVDPCTMARVLAAQSRGYDTVGRVGSQDYVWVITNLEPGMPERLIKRLNLALGSGVMEIGLAEAGDTQDADALLTQALDNLGEVKAA